jgi:NitT/TauT family transport system substrate-binding protein
MSGAYDAGFGDINAIIQNAATRPADAPLMVYMIYSKAPFALLVKADSPIKTIADIAGRKLGSPAGGAALKLFPLLAKKNNLDPTKVEVVNMAPNLQEQMLIRGDVDVSALFTATSYMNLVAIKQDPDKGFRWIYYSDGGLDLYSNGIMVSQKLARDKPEAVKGLVRAIARAMKDCIANPDAAIELLTKEPLINRDIEKQRLAYGEDVDRDAGSDRARCRRHQGRCMSDAIAAIAAAYELPKSPRVEDVQSRVPAPDSRADDPGGDQLTACGSQLH